MAVNPYTYSTTPSSNTSLNGVTMAEGMNPADVNNGVRQFAADFAALVKDIACGTAAGGSANAITLTANSAFAAYANGLIVGFKATADNTAATTLNVNAIGAKSLRTAADSALTGGEVKNGLPYLASYSTAANGGSGAWILFNPGIEIIDYTTSLVLTAAAQAAFRTNISAALKGHLYGLTLSNNGTDATNDIDIAAGEAASTESNPVLMALASSLTKRLDASWAVGSGNGGLDTGSIANTTYHVWLIQRSDTGVVDALFSTSASSPTMPANYDRKRRIGSIIRASGVILGFKQVGDTFNLNSIVAERTSTSALSDALFTLTGIPAGVVVAPVLKIAISMTGGSAASADISLGSASVGSSNVLVTGVRATVADGNEFVNALVPPIFWTNTSRQIYYEQTATSAPSSYAFSTVGWVDLRGREGGL